MKPLNMNPLNEVKLLRPLPLGVEAPALSGLAALRSRFAALALGALSAAGCGGETYEYGGIDTAQFCNPIPECPAPRVSIYANPVDPDDSFYMRSDRFFRVIPDKESLGGEIVPVCDPNPRVYCKEGQTPKDDGCSLPLCEGALEAMCDPIPSRKKDGPYQTPSIAHTPTQPFSSLDSAYIVNNSVDYPIIFDNTPDCEPGETPDGESYYVCDLIPTCEKTLPYCDPLPDCKEGQSPIVCNEDQYTYARKFSFLDDCEDYVYEDIQNLRLSGIYAADLLFMSCLEEFDTSVNETAWVAPNIEVVCRPTPDCGPGETPFQTSQSYPLECGKWGSVITTTDDYASSCDPIPSCGSN